MVTILGGSATFRCTASVTSNDFIESIQWLLNGTLVEDLDLENVEVSGLGNLRFFMIPGDYNHTSIKCKTNLTSGRAATSRAGILLIQGLF